jgi:hypothetical protein
MKILRWLALVYSLLIGGILIAPVPAEAVPTLTISVDFAAPETVSLAGSGTCPMPAGYTACYRIDTTGSYGSGSFTLVDVSLTNPARVLIADTTGAGNSLDLFTLTGVKFVPSSGLTGQHTVQAVLMNTFDAAPNPAGNYLFAMRTGGYFVASAGGNNLLNTVSLSGLGDFSGSGSVSVPILPTLSMQVGSPTSTAVSFSLSQIQPYNSFPCETPASSGICSPTIQLTFDFVVFGADSLFLTNSADAAGGNCDVVPPPTDQKPPFGLPPGPVNPCKARTGKINSFFNQASNADNRSANQAGADPFVQCVDIPEEFTCPCVDPATCNNGTITIVKTESISIGGTYDFAGTGAGITSKFSITATLSGPPGSKTFSGLTTGATGGSRSVTETSTGFFPSLSCTSALGTSTFSTSTDTATVSNLGAGDTVTCTFVNAIIGRYYDRAQQHYAQK